MKIALDTNAFMPLRVHDNDAGLDLFSAVAAVVPARGRVMIETGVHVAIPTGYVGFLTSKSGIMGKHGVTCRGTIDAGYTGSIRAVLINHSDVDYKVGRGDKVTQLVVVPCLLPELEFVDRLDDTERGSGGFGSTGIR